ncbi:hypothetical protein K3495_g3401 [Podosphaera aphanis]|nr:hypothetical protein K3495_g3401 [Podosphaera aphanis]
MAVTIFSHFTPKRLRVIRYTCVRFSSLQNRDSNLKISKPLRILFCGSDNFSVASLRAIERDFRKDHQSLIKSIDVLCRPGKPVGRGLKKIVEAPIKAAAHELGLRVHERDSFSGWDLPQPENEKINLIIAVSFGLFIPSRILQSVEYGGLNVHPSLLPNLRGAAPIHHTILAGLKFTGVSLQTLHDKSFDRGVILDQTRPHLEIPPLCTYTQLINLLSPVAAQMLSQGLHQRLFIPPLIDVAQIPDQPLIYARKITSADKKIPWVSETPVRTIVQAYCALGCLWSDVFVAPHKKMRLKFDDISPETGDDYSDQKVYQVQATTNLLSLENGRVVHFIIVPTCAGINEAMLYIENEEHRGSVNFFFPGKNPKDTWRSVRVGKITIEGKAPMTALKALQSLRQENEWSLKLEQDSGRESTSRFSAHPLQSHK